MTQRDLERCRSVEMLQGAKQAGRQCELERPLLLLLSLLFIA
jgi:hypothetical protein